MFGKVSFKLLLGTGCGIVFGAGTTFAAQEGKNIEGEDKLDCDVTWGTTWNRKWDNPHLHPEWPTSGKGERQIILIRHGQYRNEACDDDSIRTLTRLGEEQAALTGQYLKASMKDSPMFIGDHPVKIYSSNMTRAKQTARLIVQELGLDWDCIEQDRLLKEEFPCHPEPKFTGWEYTVSPDPEVAFRKHIHRPSEKDARTTEIIVGHANIIRYFACRGLQLPPEAWLRISLGHCSLTSLKVRSNGNVSMSMLGSVTHLPGEKQSVSNVQ